MTEVNRDLKMEHTNGTISLRGSSNHVLDEITMSGGINDSDIVSGSLKLPKSNVDGNTTLTLSFQFVKNPGVFK
jgi:hypothetical protein